MSAPRLALSVGLLWHVLALCVGAIPPPGTLPSDIAVRRPDTDVVARRATPALDWLALSLAPLAEWCATATAPVRPVVDTYLGALGLRQQWRMFSVPPVVDEYLRVRYYVGPVSSDPGGNAPAPRWVATELVMPAHREDMPRLVRSFRDSYRDKAMAVALEAFARRRREAAIRPDTRPEELPDALAPIARYFSRRFAATGLLPEERILRTEVWYGTALITPVGEMSTPAARDARRATLAAYYGGAVEERFAVPPYPPYNAGETEADIQWVLAYYEER